MKSKTYYAIEQYFKYMEGLIYENDTTYVGYPLDIMHDISHIINNEPNTFFIFIKDYISTSLVMIDNEHSDFIDFHIKNINIYNICLLFHHGEYHEYLLKYENQKQAVINLLEFFKLKMEKNQQRLNNRINKE